jgi:RimJ/RimL family protein N-acetyltransferase
MSAAQVRGQAVVLRPGRDSDIPDLVTSCNDPVAQRFVPSLPSPYAPAHARDWIKVSRAGAGDQVECVFADPSTDRLLGVGGFQVRREATAEIGYWVAPWARGHGVATAGARALVSKAFAAGVERVYLRNEFENTASQRVALGAGFTREGVERGGGANRGGQGRHDLIVWARLITDSQPKPRLLPDLPSGQLTDGVITLRAMGVEDTDNTFTLRTVPDVMATSVPPTRPDLESVRRTCARSGAGWLAGERADLTIWDAATGAYAGEIGLYYWEPPTQQAMIGYSLMPAWRGRGYATRAANLVATWAFDQCRIARLIAGTNPENLGSQGVLQRAGFVREGLQRSRLPGPDGTRIDDVLWARLPDS